MKTILKETASIKVYLETDKLGDQWKKFRSKEYNYNFNLRTGMFQRWGISERDDPDMSEFGPEILDFEITTSCNGIDGKLCKYCYKANTPEGKNTSFEDFKKVIQEINFNNQLTQVAFGLGSSGLENPELWNMCEYLRENHIIPNGTIAQVDNETARLISENFGGVAVSFHSDFEVLAETIKKLSLASVSPYPEKRQTLQQINVHFCLMEETYDDCLKLFEMVKSDNRFEGLNAIVLLGLKQCGRAKTGFSKLSDKKFRDLIRIAFEKKIGIGFDSCSANKFIKAAEILSMEKIQQIEEGLIDDFEVGHQLPRPEVMLEKIKLHNMLQLVEPCESGLFSSYVNVNCIYHHCSFEEGSDKTNWKGFDLINKSTSFKRFWQIHAEMKRWREELAASGRSCPIYDV